MNLIKKSLGKYKYHQLLAILFLLLGSAASIIIPKLSVNALDHVNNVAIVQQTLFIIAVSVVLSFFFLYAQSALSNWIAEQIAYDLREIVIKKLVQQTYAYVSDTTAGKLLTILTSDIKSLKEFIAQGIIQLISAVFLLIASSVLMLTLNWKLALLLIAILPIVITCFMFVFSRITKLFRQFQQMLDRFNRTIDENIKASALIRVLVAETLEVRKFFDQNGQLRSLGIATVKNFAMLFPFIGLMLNIGTVLIVWIGGHQVMGGELTIGEFSAFYSYLALFIFPVMILGFIGESFGRAFTSAHRIQQILDDPITFQEGTETFTTFQSLEMQQVSFKNVLHDLVLTIKAGEKIAFMGPTGSGKSLLLQLIPRFLEPSIGTIVLNNIPLSDYRIATFRKHVGFVLQENILFSGSVRENIAYGKEDATQEEVEKAARLAEAHDFIVKLPNGYNEIVGERGSSLSGGQKQRLTLARALLVQPQILILDDSTSRLDIVTEQKILANILQEFPIITIISVAQKIASVLQADRIYLIEEGKIIAQGTHQELLGTNFAYQQIYLSQQEKHD